MSQLPLIEELPVRLSPSRIFDLLKDRPMPFFLDSGMDPEKLGRFTFMGSDPFLIFTSRGRSITVTEGGRRRVFEGNPFDALRELLRKYRLDDTNRLVPFRGGAVGYLSYDLCHFIEKLPSTPANDLDLPESCFGFYDSVIACDVSSGTSYAISTGFPETDPERRLARARRRLAELVELADKGASAGVLAGDTPGPASGTELRCNFTREEYVRAVQKAREYIISGDIFQVNLSQRFEADLSVEPYELYRRLRSINPAPFGAYLGFEEAQIVSASPERFLRLTGDAVETRPIKGTRPRGNTPEQDQALAAELLSSLKDRAENIMIVDLERNDLGRVCRFGSVKVTERVILEAFPTVFHLTSTVVGSLKPGKDSVDLLKATFPGGSITGAPKVRSMEIIDELEPTRRSVYTGSIGYIGFDGNMDLNIAIRTFIIKNKKAYFQVGGGIVYDSDPEAEYKETLDKARALVQALHASSRVEVRLK